MKRSTIDAQIRWNDRIINTIARLANSKSIAWEKVLEEHTVLQDKLTAEKIAADKLRPRRSPR